VRKAAFAVPNQSLFVSLTFFFHFYRYCEGGELFHFIIERKHLCEREAALIMHQLLSALVYLHGQNISHRDIKPENFMLARKNDPSCVKMIDFGLSKDFSGQETMKTMSGSVSETSQSALPVCLTC
jgi:serine/threonine protein kinase